MKANRSMVWCIFGCDKSGLRYQTRNRFAKTWDWARSPEVYFQKCKSLLIYFQEKMCIFTKEIMFSRLRERLVISTVRSSLQEGQHSSFVLAWRLLNRLQRLSNELTRHVRDSHSYRAGTSSWTIRKLQRTRTVNI